MPYLLFDCAVCSWWGERYHNQKQCPRCRRPLVARSHVRRFVAMKAQGVNDTFPLRPNVDAKVLLPSDITLAEVKRLTTMIAACVQPERNAA